MGCLSEVCEMVGIEWELIEWQKSLKQMWEEAWILIQITHGVLGGLGLWSVGGMVKRWSSQNQKLGVGLSVEVWWLDDDDMCI